MAQFHESVRGAHFLDVNVPKMIKAINRLAAAIEESNELQRAPAVKANESVEAKEDKT